MQPGCVGTARFASPYLLSGRQPGSGLTTRQLPLNKIRHMGRPPGLERLSSQASGHRRRARPGRPVLGMLGEGSALLCCRPRDGDDPPCSLLPPRTRAEPSGDSGVCGGDSPSPSPSPSPLPLLLLLPLPLPLPSWPEPPPLLLFPPALDSATSPRCAGTDAISPCPCPCSSSASSSGGPNVYRR